MIRKWVSKSRTADVLWRTFKEPYFEPITQIIAASLPKWRKQNVIQIGANDGLRDDPVSPLLKTRPLWTALLVEPLPVYMSLLKKNYGLSRRIMYEQSAVGEEDGVMPFYYIDEKARHEDGWRDYFDRIGSLSRPDLITNLGDRVAEMTPYILESNVNVLAISTLLKKWKIDKVDALIVDAEGQDWKIVKQSISIGVRPKVLMFEYSHLDEYTLEGAMTILSEVGYTILRTPRDLLCIFRNAGR
jgi:FkbM family methyltransferase